MAAVAALKMTRLGWQTATYMTDFPPPANPEQQAFRANFMMDDPIGLISFKLDPFTSAISASQKVKLMLDGSGDWRGDIEKAAREQVRTYPTKGQLDLVNANEESSRLTNLSQS
jgi:hypothetical protein